MFPAALWLHQKIGDNLTSPSLDEKIYIMFVIMEYYSVVKIYVLCSKGIDFKINMESSKLISECIQSSFSL